MNAKIVLALSLGSLLCACATTPKPNAALESARVVVRAAETDPNVTRYDPLDLEAARKQLAVAESAALHHEDLAVTHPAYLATQTARLAQARGAAKADDAKVAAGQVERDRILLSARSREAQNAKAQADAAKASAEAALAQRDKAAQEAERAKAELEKMKATPTPRGMLLTLADVLFDTGQAELKSGAQRKLDELGQFLMEHAERRIQIEGFTDSVGPDDYNLDLSQRRAEAVKSAMILRGVVPSRITTEGFGKAFPVASNADSSGRQLNRRVEIIIGNDAGAQIAPRS